MIDCATARPEESAQRVDWEGKVALIQCAQARFTATAKLGEAAACACNKRGDSLACLSSTNILPFRVSFPCGRNVASRWEARLHVLQIGDRRHAVAL